MRTYKKLKSRKKETSKKGTIMEMHESKMNEFEKYYSTLPEKKEYLTKIKKKYNDSKINDSTIKYSTQHGDNSDISREKKISDLEKEIEKMTSQVDMLNYISNVQHIFAKIDEERDDTINFESDGLSTNLKNKINEGIKKYIKITQKSNRGNLVEEYMDAMNGITQNFEKEGDPSTFICTNCKGNLSINQSESMLVCKVCGFAKSWQDPDLPQWSDEVDFSKTYRYKKLGYFIEHLYRMQAQECTVIPDFVINNVMMKLREKRIRSNTNIDKKAIKGILKELDMTNYYDNINSIIRTISGKEAPKFPEDLEDKLICMFMRTLEPFEKYKSLIPSRTNYLSYPYAIRKLLEIISKEEDSKEILNFKEYFGLLKSRNKTWEHERVWKKICEENNWIFIPSI